MNPFMNSNLVHKVNETVHELQVNAYELMKLFMNSRLAFIMMFGGVHEKTVYELQE